MGFNELVGPLIDREAGYVNDTDDSGGETNFGITYRVARENGYNAPMRDMKYADAVRIYRKKYWDKIEGDALYKLSEIIAEEVFDTGVNMGIERASEYLQRSLNVLNNRGSHYPDIAVDGDIGPATLASLSALLKRRGKVGERVLNRMLNSLQGAFYVSLGERREKDERFMLGWFDNRVAS